jgi:hypothetical protein
MEGVYRTSGYGGINLDPEYIPSQASKFKGGSKWPAQVPVYRWWDCKNPLKGPTLENILGKNLPREPGNLLFRPKYILPVLSKSQVRASPSTLPHRLA